MKKNPLFLFVKSQVSIVTDKAERIQLMAEVDERLRPVMAGTAKSQWVKVCIIHGQIWQEGRGGGGRVAITEEKHPGQFALL